MSVIKSTLPSSTMTSSSIFLTKSSTLESMAKNQNTINNKKKLGCYSQSIMTATPSMQKKSSSTTSLRRTSSSSSSTSSCSNKSCSSSSSSTTTKNISSTTVSASLSSSVMDNKKYSYRTCPMCSERLLVRIHGAFVHKWINLHFANRHHEWMHVVVNLH